MAADLPVSPLLSVVLVNFNDGAHIEKCLSSVIRNAAGIESEILVVDNRSDDGSPELVERRFPRVRLIRNRENAGFSKANNRAIRESRGEFVLILNTDTELFPGTLGPLIDEMTGHPSTGIAGPALLNARNGVQVSFGGKVDFFREFFRKSFLNAVRSRALAGDSRRRETSWVSGAFMLARRSALVDAGLFDEGFFLYFEDIDLCLRAGEKGWNVVYLPMARAFHEGGATTLPRGLRSRWEYRRSQLRFYGRHCGPVSRRLLRSYIRLSAWSLRVRGLFDEEAAHWAPRFSALLKKGAAPA